MTYGCFNLTQDLQQEIEIQNYIFSLATNSTSDLMDFPNVLYELAAAQDKRSAYIGAVALDVLGGQSITIPGLGNPGVFCQYPIAGIHTCSLFLNAGVNYTDLKVNLPPLPAPLGTEGAGTEPFGNYFKWDPTGIQFFDLFGTVFGAIECRHGQTYDFSINATAGPQTTVASEGILQTSGMETFLQMLQLTPKSIVSLWGLDGLMWAANQNITTTLNPAKTALTAVSALNCTNELVSTTAKYLLANYGSFNVPQDTSLRIQYSDGYLLANTRMIDDGRGLQILLVVTLPESDYLAKITATKNQVIRVAVGVAVAMLILGVAVSFLITMPVRRFVTIMQQATAFDFSALHQGYIEDRSYVMEISHMQDVFETMLKKFAHAIKASNSLAQGSRKLTLPPDRARLNDLDIFWTSGARNLGHGNMWTFHNILVVLVSTTAFDFSALQHGYVADRSYVMEIAHMQYVFETMLKKFANAIKNNMKTIRRSEAAKHLKRNHGKRQVPKPRKGNGTTERIRNHGKDTEPREGHGTMVGNGTTVRNCQTICRKKLSKE
ncbi:hypothetical protein BDK51DRAFT_33945 [Blyttiomyces helicus]|uniref:HAMP domain-containing protein n=1 Tax=Blyttiomyces helicus TaxID=388810 RepID=A0A4P9W445_9FUNG|nr:hypothetical protein BDK51DRAFT_33945 [Blyttiomyces helicus]|eukprot:RKO86944.1 hypothetical protein BDK51DRAFT_33945 [Blyttiomyces helicus]